MDGAAYREQATICPSCKEPLVEQNVFGRPVRRCDGCLGEWADEATLLALFSSRTPMGHQPPSRLAFYFIDPIHAYGGATRHCPICKSPLRMTGLARLPVERCERDGGWFDRGKLAVALSRPTDVAWPPPPVDQIPLARPRNWGTEIVVLVAGILFIVLLSMISFLR